ncbi:hypothetical protein [Thermomonas carbonis]|uniref:Uncharacterized protein n=1 Tax=Thermomonas carbonis TaxID=1463158 RepID=A0A7G9SNE0_9GAMM|nr:hypothetical protein [Thermomonas carbonis]QNN69365.1 hypothetical protein H9L16_11865 [Thermomonas carbonis]
MNELLGGVPYVIRRCAKCCNQSDEDKKAEPEVERNWHLVQAAFHGRRVQPPAVVALLASELIALAVYKSEEQVEPAEFVGELGFEVPNGITAWAVVLLQGPTATILSPWPIMNIMRSPAAT